MSKIPEQLSPILKALLDLELGRGNSIRRIDAPAGTLCPLAVVMNEPLMTWADSKIHDPQLKKWVSTDPHYEIERGFKCLRTQHILSGPIPESDLDKDS